MRWAFLDRWETILRLEAVARGDRVVATARTSAAFDEVGASIVDVKFFSGVRTVLNFEVEPASISALMAALEGAGLELNDVSRARAEAAARADGEIVGTLAITFAEGDPDLVREVPAVPG